MVEKFGWMYRHVNMAYILNRLLLTGLLLTSTLSVADESLASLMQQLKSTTATHMSYQETRTLELMDEDWHGSGYLYAIPPHIMIREQLTPKHLYMGVINNEMYYFDPESDIHYNTRFDENNPLTLSIAAFKALMSADEQFLQKLYRVDFYSTVQSWQLFLKPKHDADSSLRIKISGATGQQASQFHVSQDGETSEVILQNKAQGNQLKPIIEPIIKILTGK